MCSFLPAHRRGLPGRPRLRPLKNFLQLRTREVQREPDRRTSGSVKLQSSVTALGQQGTKAEPGRLGVWDLRIRGVPAPPGVVMLAPPQITRTASRAQSEGRAAAWGPSAAKGIMKAGARTPRPGVLTKELQ